MYQNNELIKVSLSLRGVLSASLHKAKMEEGSTTKFVQLSKRIFVPKQWPIRGIETFLLKLAETVIDDVTSDKFIVLQVHNIPTVLVRDEGKHETRYFFEIISKPWQIDAYVIDVVFGENDMSSNSMESEDSATDEVSSDEYIIVTRQSDNRTAYHLIAAKENVRAVSPEKRIDFETQQLSARRAKRRAMGYDALILLAAMVIAGLAYRIVMNIISSD